MKDIYIATILGRFAEDSDLILDCFLIKAKSEYEAKGKVQRIAELVFYSIKATKVKPVREDHIIDKDFSWSSSRSNEIKEYEL